MVGWFQCQDDAINWQNALHQAAIEATIDVISDCLQELPFPSLLERFPFARTTPDETRNWLENAKVELSEELRKPRKGKISWQVSGEAQKQIEVLLQPKGVLGSERAR